MGTGSIPWRERRQLPPKLTMPVIARRLFPECTFSVNGDGYWVARTRPWRDQYLHRMVMAIVLGRKLERTEVVHHMNGNRLCARPHTLVLMTKDEHDVLVPRCPWTGRIMTPEEWERRVGVRWEGGGEARDGTP